MDVNLCASSCHGGKFCVPTDQREMPFGNGGFERSVPCQVQSKQTMWLECTVASSEN